MKLNVLGPVAAIALVATSGALAAPTYFPTGPQQNVSFGTVTGGGWTECYREDFGTPFGTSAATALAGCGGDYLLVAGYEKGENSIALLAAALKSDALLLVATDASHLANGSEWYNTDSWSFGFGPAGGGVARFECDTLAGAERLCIHTLNFVGGYRVGDVIGLNGSTTWEKIVYTASAVDVPAPAGFALFGLGLLGLAALRRR